MNKSAKQTLEQRISNASRQTRSAKAAVANRSASPAGIANVVSIKRLGFSDLVVTCAAMFNSMRMFELLHDAGIEMNLERKACFPRFSRR